MRLFTFVCLRVAAAQKHVPVLRRLRDQRGHRRRLLLHLQTLHPQRDGHGVRSQGRHMSEESAAPHVCIQLLNAVCFRYRSSTRPRETRRRRWRSCWDTDSTPTSSPSRTWVTLRGNLKQFVWCCSDFIIISQAGQTKKFQFSANDFTFILPVSQRETSLTFQLQKAVLTTLMCFYSHPYFKITSFYTDDSAQLKRWVYFYLTSPICSRFTCPQQGQLNGSVQT